MNMTMLLKSVHEKSVPRVSRIHYASSFSEHLLEPTLVSLQILPWNTDSEKPAINV